MIRVSMDYAFFTEDETYKETEHIEKVSAQVSITILVMTEPQCGSLGLHGPVQRCIRTMDC